MPAEYAGPPADIALGTVLGTSGVPKDALRPRLSLEWLASLDEGASLLGQPLRFERSANLKSDWDIGLELPLERATFESPYGAGERPRVGVGKIVYFDDRVPDERLDWSCTGAGCDVAKAVSAEFVVFVARAPTCRSSTGSSVRSSITPGFHYFRRVAEELEQGEALQFQVLDQAPKDIDPTEELRAFAQSILFHWGVLDFNGC